MTRVGIVTTVLALGAATAATAAAQATAAAAQTEPGLKLKISYAVQADANLFRLPAGANTQALLGTASRDERIGISSVGLSFNTTQSLQNFALDVNLVNYRYQNFSYLNSTATNYDAAWRWAFTPKLRGNLTSTRKEVLNSYADYTGYNLRNQRTDSHTRLDANYQLDGPWQLVAGLSSARQVNQQVLVSGWDYTTTSTDVGVRHVLGSGSNVSYSARRHNGSYLNRALSASSLYDNAFTQLDNDLRVHWVISGNSTAEFNLTHLQRSHPNYPTRDYSGFASGASLNWSLSGKTGLSASYAHELGAYQTANSNYTQTDRITLGPTWQISAKTLLSLSHSWAQTDYLGTPSALAPSQRRDTTSDTTLSVLWQPYQALTLSAALQRLARSSTLAGLDFDSTLATFSANYSY